MTMRFLDPGAHMTIDCSARGAGSWARTLWAWLMHHSRREPRSLRLCESLPLGDRRFVAVVQYERARFLVGGTSASLVMLARLGSEGDEGTVLVETQNKTGPHEEPKEQRA